MVEREAGGMKGAGITIMQIGLLVLLIVSGGGIEGAIYVSAMTLLVGMHAILMAVEERR